MIALMTVTLKLEMLQVNVFVCLPASEFSWLLVCGCSFNIREMGWG